MTVDATTISAPSSATARAPNAAVGQQPAANHDVGSQSASPQSLRPAPASEPRRKLVVFCLDEQQYGIDIMSVREIRMAQTITYIPGAPDHICGVINLRGSIVPVCDLRARFGNGETVLAPSQRIVITIVDGRPVGVLVDDVLDIVAVPVVDFEPVPAAQSAKEAMFKALVTTSQGGLIIVIDLDRLVDPWAIAEGTS